MNFSHEALVKHLPVRKSTPPPEPVEEIILLLAAPPADFAGTVIIGEMSGWSSAKKRIDPAGLAFEHFLQHGKFPHQLEQPKDESPDASVSDVDNDDETTDAHSDEYLKKKRKKLHTEDDYYELLGLGHLRHKSNQKDIRDAYRKMVLVHHPDKGGDDAVFKKIFKAHDTLSNENKKRIYDSSEHFDDSFPTDIPAGKDFYTVFAEVFERFSKWSVDKDIPSLGDANTNLIQVNKFYKFWNSFQSWRDFSFDVEYDLEEADSREEKRWMERQNKKGIEKLKKDEKSKIVKLVETAYRIDPRVNRMKEAMEAETQRRKQAREDAIRKLKEEGEKKEAAEKAKKEAAEQAKIQEAKNFERQRNRQAADLRKAKDKLRQVAYANNMNLEHLERIFNEIKQAPALNALCKEIDLAFIADPKKAHSLIVSMIDDFKKKEAEKFFEKKANEPKESKTGAPWSQEELAQLSRAVTKIPPGVQRRWELISELIPTRTSEQIIAKVQETKLKRPEELNKEKEAAAADAFALSQKQSVKGEKVHIASAPSQRFEVYDESAKPEEEEDEETKNKRLEEEEARKKKTAEKKKRAAELKKQKEEEERKKKEEEEAKIKAEEEKRKQKKAAAVQKKLDEEKKKKEELAAAAEAKKAAAAEQKAQSSQKKAEIAAKKKAEEDAKKAAEAEAKRAQEEVKKTTEEEQKKKTAAAEAKAAAEAPKKVAAPKKKAAPAPAPVDAPKVKSFSAAAGGVNAVPTTDSALHWTPQQQKALEAALAKYPTSLGAARWDKIAADVPDKTKKECIARFKHLAEAVKAKQQKA